MLVLQNAPDQRMHFSGDPLDISLRSGQISAAVSRVEGRSRRRQKCAERYLQTKIDGENENEEVRLD